MDGDIRYSIGKNWLNICWAGRVAARNIKYEAQMLFLSLDRLFEHFSIRWKCIFWWVCASENRCANEMRAKTNEKSDDEGDVQQHSTNSLSISISYSNIQSLRVSYLRRFSLLSCEYIVQKYFSPKFVLFSARKIWRIRICVMFGWYSLWVIFGDLGIERVKNMIQSLVSLAKKDMSSSQALASAYINRESVERKIVRCVFVSVSLFLCRCAWGIRLATILSSHMHCHTHTHTFS